MRNTSIITLLTGLLILALVFSLGITDGHIGLDDWGYTSGCPFVRDGFRWGNVARAFSDLGYGAIWMPVTFISYMLDVSCFGDSWKAYHAVNVGLHICNAILVYRLLKAVLARYEGFDASAASVVCVISALLWAAHPLRVEAVSFVASRKEELWTLFSLLGVLSYLSFQKTRKVRWYGLTVLFFVFAFMSKPTAMCFPFVLLAIIYIEGSLTKKVLIELIPMFVLSVGVGLLTVYSQSNPSNAVAVDVYQTTFIWRLFNALVSVGLYMWYTIWPINVHMDYLAVFDGWPVDAWLGVSIAAISFVLILLVYFRRDQTQRRVLVGSLLLFLFSIGPTLGVLGFVNGDQAMADRYTYFPHIALSVLLAYWLMKLTNRTRAAVFLCGVPLLVFEVVTAIPVVRSFESGFTAYSRVLRVDPENWRALRIVGYEYCARMNRLDEGVDMLQRSFRLRKSQLTADYLAYVLAVRGRAGDFQTVKSLGSAVARSPRRDKSGMMLDALGIVSMREGRYEQAAEFFAQSLKAEGRTHPSDWSRLYLGLNLANVGRRNEAAKELMESSNSKVAEVARKARVALAEIASGSSALPFKWE